MPHTFLIPSPPRIRVCSRLVYPNHKPGLTPMGSMDTGKLAKSAISLSLFPPRTCARACARAAVCAPLPPLARARAAPSRCGGCHNMIYDDPCSALRSRALSL